MDVTRTERYASVFTIAGFRVKDKRNSAAISLKSGSERENSFVGQFSFRPQRLIAAE